MRPPREDTKPWYRQFWPWFLIALPGTVVIASLITIYIATMDPDGLVKDNYYKEGLAINRDIAREKLARQLGVVADVHYDAASGDLRVELNDAAVGTLAYVTLDILHPTRPTHDQSVRLLPETGNRVFTGQSSPPPLANWRLTLTPPDQSWTLHGRMRMPEQASQRLQ